MGRYNDLDMKRWKEYEDLETDSLWIIDRRDNSGVHSGSYHGNFVPQIPNQLLRRYTKAGEWVLDPFMGSGTTLIESQRLGRNSIGIELRPDVADDVEGRLEVEKRDGVSTKVVVGDSRVLDVGGVLDEVGVKSVQFVIYHPPYWDIVRFSEEKEDLSNCGSLDEFLGMLGDVIDNTSAFLDRDRYCACVIGDKYSDGRVVPLGFRCMEKFLERGFVLKGIVVKNYGETKGKNGKQGIWRYRALANDFYVFKHEYVMVFKKV